MKIMASGPITSWEIDGETVETVRDLIVSLTSMLFLAWNTFCLMHHNHY